MSEPRVALVTGSAWGMGRAMCMCWRLPVIAWSASIASTRSPARTSGSSADLLDPAVPRHRRRDHRHQRSPRHRRPQCRLYVPTHPLPDVTLEDYDLLHGVNLRAVFFRPRPPPRR